MTLKESCYFNGLGVPKDSVMVTLHYGEWHKTYQVDNETFDKIKEMVSGHPVETEIVDAVIVDVT